MTIRPTINTSVTTSTLVTMCVLSLAGFTSDAARAQPPAADKDSVSFTSEADFDAYARAHNVPGSLDPRSLGQGHEDGLPPGVSRQGRTPLTPTVPLADRGWCTTRDASSAPARPNDQPAPSDTPPPAPPLAPGPDSER